MSGEADNKVGRYPARTEWLRNSKQKFEPHKVLKAAVVIKEMTGSIKVLETDRLRQIGKGTALEHQEVGSKRAGRAKDRVWKESWEAGENRYYTYCRNGNLYQPGSPETVFTKNVQTRLFQHTSASKLARAVGSTFYEWQ